MLQTRSKQIEINQGIEHTMANTTKTSSAAAAAAPVTVGDLVAMLKEQLRAEVTEEVTSVVLGGTPLPIHSFKFTPSTVSSTSRGPSGQRTKDGMNASEFIRSLEFDIPVKEVVARAAKKGLTIKGSLVYQVRRNVMLKEAAEKEARAAARAAKKAAKS
jgi:hypothetical protein